MNLNELWVGQDYAYYLYKGRGEIYRSGAERVKIIRPYKTESSGYRMRGMAEVLLVDRETGEPELQVNGEHKTKHVKARDIAMRWEEYKELDAHRKAELERREKERRERMQRIEQERQELEAKEARAKEEIKQKLLLNHNIPEQFISYIDGTYVHLKRAAIESANGLGKETIVSQ